MNQSELLHMLKNGRREEVAEYVREFERQNYTDNFVSFMDQMIREHRISRKQVALRSGLSQDYTYKLLRGDKHTDERDYILAMCMAIGMTLAQTQHALSCYGMPLLSDRDVRGHLIILALEDGMEMDALDDVLEKAGLPAIRTSPDMPSASITSTEQVQKAEVRQKGKFEEIDSFVHAEHNGGNSPFDYDYQGWIRVEDEAGNRYQVEAIFSDEGNSFIVFTEEQRRHAEELMKKAAEKEQAFWEAHEEELKETGGEINFMDQPELFSQLMEIRAQAGGADMLECYDTLEDAAGSAFFSFFLEIDKRTDKKVLEVLRDLDDTRKYGSRVGSSWTGSQPQIYMEAFNDKEPEKREYFQVVEYRDGTCRYTASHESCFLRLEMGMDLYSAYYGVKQEPEYFLDSPDNAFTGDQVRYRFIFSSMKSYLDEYFLEKEGLVQPDPDMVEREKTETLTEKAVQLFHAEQYEESVHVLHEVLDLIGTEVSSDDLCVYICTCAKVAMTYCQMNQEEAEDEWWQKVLSMKERVLNEVKDGNQSALSCIVDAYVHFYRKLHRADDDGAYDSLAQALSLIEEHIPSFDKWPVLFEVYFSWAWHMEETDLDQCITYYRKAIAVARNHHLDQIPWCAQSVATTYFNFGWVLWNLAGSEEAIIPLGRALELMEDYDANHRISHETVLARMEHYGQELLTLYQQTSRTREAQDLVNHLREYGVDLEKQTE